MAMSAAKLKSEFTRLLAPRLLAALKADAKRVTRLGGQQRKALLALLRKHMAAEQLKKALATIRPKWKPSRKLKPKRKARIRRR